MQLRKLKIDLPQDPKIAMSGNTPKVYIFTFYRDTFSYMFIAALFIVVRNGKQPRCLSTDEYMVKMLYI